MRQCMDADNLHRRLKKIIGQVQAIDRTRESGNICPGVTVLLAGRCSVPR